MAEYSLENLMCHQDNLETVLDNLKEGIIAHDMNRRIFFFNKEAERITGYNREEIVGRDCHEAFGSPFCGEHCAFCVDEPELAKRVELRHFAGLTVEETAQALGVSARTVKRNWAFARAWLGREMNHETRQ